MKKIKLSICLIAGFLSLKELRAQTATTSTTTSVVTTSSTTTTPTTEVGTNPGSGTTSPQVTIPPLKEPITNENPGWDQTGPETMHPCYNEALTDLLEFDPYQLPNGCQDFPTDTSWTGHWINIPVQIHHARSSGGFVSYDNYRESIDLFNDLLRNLDVYPGKSMHFPILDAGWMDVSAHTRNRFRLYLSECTVDGDCEGNNNWLETVNIGKSRVNINELHFAFPEVDENYLHIYIADTVLNVNGNPVAAATVLPQGNGTGMYLTADKFFEPEQISTFLHEFGHWLALEHIFGADYDDYQDPCDDTDFIDDTPTQSKDFYHVGYDQPWIIPVGKCGNEEMIFNYMGYTALRSMFTNDQYDLMRKVLHCDPVRKNAWRNPWTKNSDVIFSAYKASNTDPLNHEQAFITKIIIEKDGQEFGNFEYNQLPNGGDNTYLERLEGYGGEYGYQSFLEDPDAIIDLSLDRSYNFYAFVAAKKSDSNDAGTNNFEVAAYIDVNRDGEFDIVNESLTYDQEYGIVSGDVSPNDQPQSLANDPIAGVVPFYFGDYGLNDGWALTALYDYLDEKYPNQNIDDLTNDQIYLPTVLRVCVGLGVGDVGPKGRAQNGECEDYPVRLRPIDFAPSIVDPNYKSASQSLIYPNPAQNELTLLADATTIKQVDFYNITTGGLVLSHSLSQNTESRVTLNISTLPSNAEYIVRIIGYDGRTVEEHLIKR